LVAALKEAYHEGIFTRDAVEEDWQAEMGKPLPADIAEAIFGPGGQAESGTASDTPPPNAT
jgi:hypothetical protein